jgi:hypothetical protein
VVIKRTKPTKLATWWAFVLSVSDRATVGAERLCLAIAVGLRRKSHSEDFGQEYPADPRFTAKACLKKGAGSPCGRPGDALDPVQDGGEPDRATGSLLSAADVVKPESPPR